MKKKLLVLLIAIIPTLMPNLVSAVAVYVCGGLEFANSDSLTVEEGECKQAAQEDGVSWWCDSACQAASP